MVATVKARVTVDHSSGTGMIIVELARLGTVTVTAPPLTPLWRVAAARVRLGVSLLSIPCVTVRS